jgi:hypothetical protein
MIFASEFGTPEVWWSFFWFALFFLWIFLVIEVFGDIIASHDISGLRKALWTLAIIIFPYLGVFAYLVVRGRDMADRTRRARVW